MTSLGWSVLEEAGALKLGKARTMTKHKTKTELLDDIQVQRRRLQKSLDRLTRSEMLAPGVVGEWSVKDLLAHLTAWEKLFLSWYAAGLQGTVTAIVPVGMSKKDMDELNQQIYEENQARSLDEIQAEFVASYQRLWVTLQAMPEDEIFDNSRYTWTGRLTIADYIAGNTCNHYRWAKTQIKKIFD
jgi:hypothetical protein